MVKTTFGRSVRMTFKTGLAVIGVTANAIMLIAGFALFVAGDTGKIGIITRIWMAFGTSIPFTLVIPGINREKLSIVIKCSGSPGNFAMT